MQKTSANQIFPRLYEVKHSDRFFFMNHLKIGLQVNK